MLSLPVMAGVPVCVAAAAEDLCKRFPLFVFTSRLQTSLPRSSSSPGTGSGAGSSGETDGAAQQIHTGCSAAVCQAGGI